MLMNPPPVGTPSMMGYNAAAMNRQSVQGMGTPGTQTHPQLSFPDSTTGTNPMIQALLGDRQMAMSQAPGLNPTQGVQSQGLPGPVLPHMQPQPLHPATAFKPPAPGMLHTLPPAAPRGM